MIFSRSYKTILISVFVLVLMSSCSKDNVTEIAENSLVTVKLKATESLFSEMNIEILDVQFRVLEDETEPNAWMSLNAINSGVYDLTSLTQERALSLVEFEDVPSQFIYSIRIVLGNQNSVVFNGVEYDLDSSSEFQNTSVNIIEKQLNPNTLYEFEVEFEIDRSVVLSSDGVVNFNPRINTLMRRFQLN